MPAQAKYHREEVQRARKMRDRASSVEKYREALFVILHAEYGMEADILADVLGINLRTAERDRCRQDGSIGKKWGGRRTSSMTFEEERDFLASWKEKAAQSGILTISPIHAALVERLGHVTTMSTTYRLLARHGWRKVTADSKQHTCQDSAPGVFRKVAPKMWLPDC